MTTAAQNSAPDATNADHKPSRRSFLKLSAGVVGALALGDAALDAFGAESSPPKQKPNLIIFLGEGLRYDELSCAGHPIVKTPHMDRMAREGMMFKNAFVTNALCLPSRAGLLTGLYSHSINATGNVPAKPGPDQKGNGNGPIPHNIPLVSDLLHKAGYEVAFFGKAHIKHALQDRYWDYYFGFNGRTDYYNPLLTEGIAGKYSEPKRYEGYLDDVVTDRALQWLEQKREKPFCVFLNPFAPHAPFYRARRHLDLYNGIPIPKPATFDDDLKGYPGKPRAFAEANNKIGTTILGDDNPRTLEEVAKDHYAGVVDNDDNLGRVVDLLEREGQLDDTAVIVTSDHGFFLGEWRMYDKRFMHEPSIRVPLIVRYPRLVKAGSSCEEMALNVDIAPTLLELAGVRPPSLQHGRSLVPILKSEPPADWRKDWLYEYFEYPEWEHVRPHRGVRTERYKLIHYHKLAAFPEEPEEFELYDLDKDPGELNNLYGRPGYATLTLHLLARITELRKETGDDLADS
ncbi:MAG TPA: sulfatase-like hydrolase/transferase [Candidatus Angelobacter sp.]|nr:sulfatase-like hydrolase/transferase [Candidatus Angelobacter sp.]